MATDKEINDINNGVSNSEKLLDLSNQLLNSYSERKKALKEITAEERLYFATVSQQQRLSQQIAANADKYLGYLIKSKDLNRDIKATQDNISKSIKAYASIEEKVNKDKQNAITKFRDLRKKEKNIQSELDNLAFKNEEIRTKIQKSRIQSEIDNLLQQVRDNNKIADIKERSLKITNKETEKQRSIAESARKIIKDQKESEESQQKELDFLNANLVIRKRIEKSTGLLGAISKSVAKIPGIGQYLNADETIDEMEKLAASIAERGEDATSFGNRLKIAGKGLSTLAKGFYENIKSPEAVFSFFINAAMTANKESVNLSKNLGYGAANADRLRANFADIERSSGNLNVTTANLSEAFNELSSATGFVTEYSADALTTQIKLTKQLGLSGDEAAGVYKFSVLTGQSSEATYKSMLKGYVATRNSLNVGVPFKAAMAEAAKVTGQLAANMGYNAENIIRGVVSAKALGTSLEQAKQQGETLLDFQSSIENELKAELITGQQLNLERARAAALMGDQVTVAEELAAQGMTAAKFAQMNTITQKSYAQALGTTSDELANQLMKREQAIASGKSLAQITAEEADSAAERQDIQTKFNAAMEKLQSIIGNLVAGPLGTMLEILSQSLGLISSIGLGLAAWYTTSKLIAGSQALIAWYSTQKLIADRLQLGVGSGIVAQLGRMLGISVAKAAAETAAATAISFGTLLPIILGAGVAAYSLFKSFNADDYSNDGYGKRTLLTPEGSIRFNDNDKIIAGTNLDGGIKSPQATMDLSPVIAAMNNMTKSVDRLHDKETVIKMGTKEVGTALMMGSYRSA
jgi:hypothetical protein